MFFKVYCTKDSCDFIFVCHKLSSTSIYLNFSFEASKLLKVLFASDMCITCQFRGHYCATCICMNWIAFILNSQKPCPVYSSRSSQAMFFKALAPLRTVCTLIFLFCVMTNAQQCPSVKYTNQPQAKLPVPAVTLEMKGRSSAHRNKMVRLYNSKC